MLYALGAAAASTTAMPAPRNSAAWTAANGLSETAGRIMEHALLDDVRYAGEVIFRDWLERVREMPPGEVARIPRPAIQQIVLGSVLQAKRGIARLRMLAYASSPKARRLADQLAQKTGAVLHRTWRMVLAVESASRTRGTSGLGWYGVLCPVCPFAVEMLADWYTSVYGLQIAIDAVDSCDTCTEEERQVLRERFAGVWEERQRADAKSGGDMFGISEGISSVVKVVGIGAAVVAGGYLLWVTWPLLSGGGKAVRSGLKRKMASNRRRRSRR